MSKFNKERIMEMISMRIDGFTYEEIGKKFDVSKQRAHQVVLKAVNETPKKVRNYKYPNLYFRIMSNYSTAGEFAELVGVSKDKISNYLRGTTRPPLETVVKICELLEEDVAYLFATAENGG